MPCLGAGRAREALTPAEPSMRKGRPRSATALAALATFRPACTIIMEKKGVFSRS